MTVYEGVVSKSSSVPSPTLIWPVPQSMENEESSSVPLSV